MKRIALASLILALQLNVIAATDAPWMPESHQAPGPGDSKVYEQMLKVLQDPEIILQEVKFRNGSDSINGFLARPNKTGRLPALVVVPGDPGLTAYTRVTAAQFAQAGFVALAVDIFSRAAGIQDLQEARRIYFDVMSDPLTLGDLQSAIVFLKQQEFVRSGGVGVVGFCLGGRYALLLSTLSLDVRAVVAFYGPLALQSGAPDVASAKPVKLLNHDMSPVDFVPWIKATIQGHYSERDDGIPVADALHDLLSSGHGDGATQKPSVRRPPPLFKKWMPISGSELSNQSRKLFSDFVQSFQPSFVIFHFELAMRATSPINAIVLSNLGDFSSKRNETFDDV